MLEYRCPLPASALPSPKPNILLHWDNGLLRKRYLSFVFEPDFLFEYNFRLQVGGSLTILVYGVPEFEQLEMAKEDVVAHAALAENQGSVTHEK
jgi:hypothetical protein